MLRRVRALWRAAREVRVLRPAITAADRLWWARTIRHADVVDMDYVVAQGLAATPRRAVRAYVRGAFRQGFCLNPLFHEQLVASQLQEAGRVPPLYAYLVNDVSAVRTSISWDTAGYARASPASLSARGGPLGHAWRSARSGGVLEIGRGDHVTAVDWRAITDTAIRAVGRGRGLERDDPLPDLTGRTVFLSRVGRRETDVAAALAATADVVSSGDTDAILAIAATAPDVWTQAALLTLWLPRVSVRGEHPRLLELIESRSPRTSVLLVRGPHAAISGADLLAVSAEAAQRPAAPLWLDEHGTVAAAGLVAHDGRAFPLLAGHPREDALALGERIETIGVAGETFARPVGRVDPRAGATTLLDREVRTPSSRQHPQTTVLDDSDVNGVFATLGMRVKGWSTSGPRLERLPSHYTLPDGTTVPRLRWAIKIASPSGRPGEAWGDTHFARGVAAGLRRLGQEVVIDAYDARARPSVHLDDVVLALRGPEPILPQPGARSIMWIISHPDELTADQLRGFDAVFASSPTWARTASERFGAPIRTLLQATDATRFAPTGAARTHDVVFVGTARGIPRPSVVEPIRRGIPVAVYGPDWRGWIPATAIRASGIANAALPLLYERAAAVLNDHWPAMKEAAFVSNRLFDVVAAGGRAISDDVDGISDIFGGAVRTYRTIDELMDLLHSDLDAVFPDPTSLARLSEAVRRDHSFDARARTLLEAALAA